MHDNYTVKFDATKFIDHFGGIAGSVVALKSLGMRVKAKTLQKQRERGNIPADTVASLMLASRKLGRPIDPYSCLLQQTDDLRSN